jgi:CMP/dCMP kinase
MIVAIDGPAGSGKSTVAREVARRLVMRYLDTGAMYRAIALRALREGVSLEDEAALGQLVDRSAISFAYAEGEPLPTRILLDGEDVSEAIRTPEVDGAVSFVARQPAVREAMVVQQRALAREGDVVVEGRDIGTVVFPDAELKVYLTATPEERARRRTEQQETSGVKADRREVLDAIEQRDRIDSTREHSPLTFADDAIPLDTTLMTQAEVVDQVVELVRERRA